MKWKKLSAWMKGGIIGAIIFLILLILHFIALSTSDMGDIFGEILIFISFPLGMLIGNLFSISSFLIEIFYFFIVGALIGFIVGKIKSKKK